MRGLSYILIAVLQAACAFGQMMPLPPRTEAQQRLCDALDGRSIQGHLYPDLWSDPNQHTAVSIPCVDGMLQLGDLKLKHSSTFGTAEILIRGEDQTDAEVARVLDRFVIVFDCATDQRRHPFVSLLGRDPNDAPSWTFIDALGQPMAGASIEARMPLGITSYKATLDDKGQTPRRFGMHFTFRVEHPNYGVAITQSVHMAEHPSDAHIVPLIPRDSREFSLAAQGEVIDDTGKPVRNAMVQCTQLAGPDGTELYALPWESPVITDAYGRFAICLPTMTEEFRWQGPPQAGAKYGLEIVPPLESNLRRANIEAKAGTKQTFILTRMDAQEYFHTFSFEYAEGPVTSEEELKNIRLILVRDGRWWRNLTYEQWKNGVALPQGELEVTAMRWGERFRFPDVLLTADSPANIVVKATKPLTYRGRVVDGVTGQPVQGVFVQTYSTYSPDDLRSEADKLRDRAAQEVAGGPPGLFYMDRNRATRTDANGVFQFTFVPGIASDIHELYAIALDRRAGRIQTFHTFPRPDRVVDVGTIKLVQPQDRTHQFPTMIFHDEKGPVTDRAKLKAIEIEIKSPAMTMMGVRPYDDAPEEQEFMAGTYYAQVEWDHKLYTFEPVEVNSPLGVFTFRPRRIEKADVVYEGRIVHAITGQPVAGAVLLHGGGTPGRDPAPLTSEQWAAIRALGPRIDPNHPAMAPLKSIFEHSRDSSWYRTDSVTQTDSNGRFSLSVKLSIESPRNSLAIVAPDFLGSLQSLEYFAFSEDRGFNRSERRRLEADANGVTHVPLIELAPAAKVLIHPVVSDPGHGNQMQDVRFNWTSPPDAEPSWMHDSLTSPPEGPHISLFYTRSLPPNVTQSLYVPADAKLALTMYSYETTVAPAHLGIVTLKQGQVLDLGRVKFPPGVRVTVKVVDSKSNPILGAFTSCTLESGFERMLMAPGRNTGSATLSLPVHSSGTFRATDLRARTPTTPRVSVPFRIAGPEDAGKEFILRFPDDTERQPLEDAEAAPPPAASLPTSAPPSPDSPQR